MNPHRVTTCGEVAGTACQWPNVEAYLGIRYAEAGRWELPRMVKAWDGVYDATHYGAASYQPRAFYDEAQMPEKAFYYHEFREGEHYDYSEDCLFLNIWTPAGTPADAGLPVIFYIHGGGFTGGCGNEKHFDGPVWSQKGVVAVTINYRLGPLGFCCLPELEQEAGHCGNYGLYDQLCALKWVRANIAAFGGDSQNITIMGQSAGAMSVQQLCLSPLAQGLFSRAVMSSGGGVNEAFGAVAAASDLFPFWERVMDRAGCASLAEFRALDAASLFEAWQTETRELKATRPDVMSCSPVLDGAFIPCAPAEAVKHGAAARVPYMLGSNSQDIATLPIFHMAKDWCDAQEPAGGKPSFAWFFERQLPGDDNGAWHSADLWYWFGALDHCWRPMTDHDRALSDLMSTYLVNFAKTGDPNGEGLPHWDAASQDRADVMHFGDGAVHMGPVDDEELRYTMEHTEMVGE